MVWSSLILKSKIEVVYMAQKKLSILVEGAVMVAFAEALEYIPHTVGVSAIEVQFGLIPVVLYALRRGVQPGILAGFVWGILDMLLRGFSGGSVLNVWQGLLEFPVAFALVGLAGIAARGLRSASSNRGAKLIVYGTVVGTVAKYACHFIAGIVYWGSYAPKGQSAWLYSLIINGGSAIVSTIVATLVLVAIKLAAPRLFRVQA